MLTLDAWTRRARYFRHHDRKIAYWSEGSGRPLLLIHGYPTASWDWHRVWGAFSKKHQVVACDMLGFGLSDKPRSGYSIHQQAELQEALLTRLGITAFDVVAHDYGVSVGQELLARRNERVDEYGLGRIAFLNGGLFPEQHRMLPIQRLGISRLGFLLGKMMNRKRFGANFSRVFGRDTQPTERELDDFWQLITYQDGHRIAHQLLHYIKDRRTHRERWVSALQHSAVPIKLVNGGADPVSGRHMYDYFLQMVPKAEAVCLQAVGHYPQTEAPEQVLAELDSFLQTV